MGRMFLSITSFSSSVLRGAALAAGCALACSPVRADQPLWELGMGLTVLRLPHYRGSDQSHGWLLPLPYFVYRGEFLKADREGAHAMLYESGSVNIDMSLAASAPTRSQDNRAREGMPNLAATLEFGPKLVAVLAKGADWHLDFRLPLRAAISVKSQPKLLGWTSSPSLTLDIRSKGWDIGMLTGPMLNNRSFNGYYYDVPAAFATASRPLYRAAGGYGGWQATLGASRRDGPLWYGVFVRADLLNHSSFDASPLVRSRSNGSVGVALSWVFASSSQRVPDDQ